MTVNTLVLAGGRNSPEMQEVTGVTNRALVMLGDMPMLNYVVEALTGTDAIGQIYVVGVVPEDTRYNRVEAGKTLMDNVLAGLNAVSDTGDDAPVLVVTSDIPFLTPEGVEDFITLALAANADLCYPIVPMALYRQRFPTLKRTTLKLREGTFTGGNIMLVNPRFLRAHQETVQRAYAARKSVSQLGRMLGWGLLGRIALAQTLAPSLLTLPLLERGVARLLGGGCRARAIITQYPEIGTDIDSPADVAIANDLLNRTRR